MMRINAIYVGLVHSSFPYQVGQGAKEQDGDNEIEEGKYQSVYGVVHY
jgi:hypothetical protein